METLEQIIGAVGIVLAVVVIAASVTINWLWKDDPDDPDEHAERDRRQP